MPGQANSATEAVNKLSEWNRARTRATTMQVSIPDSSLLLKGLDSLADPTLRKYPQVAFRCNGARNMWHLDHRPSLGVREYSKVLQSEFEMLSVSGVEELRIRVANQRLQKPVKLPKLH